MTDDSSTQPLELISFTVLIVASVWDFKVKRRACSTPCSE